LLKSWGLGTFRIAAFTGLLDDDDDSDDDDDVCLCMLDKYTALVAPAVHQAVRPARVRRRGRLLVPGCLLLIDVETVQRPRCTDSCKLTAAPRCPSLVPQKFKTSRTIKGQDPSHEHCKDCD